MCSRILLEAHILTVGELATHTHAQYVTANPGIGTYNTRKDFISDELKLDKYYQLETGTTGGNQYHNNISASVAAYVWRRIAKLSEN